MTVGPLLVVTMYIDKILRTTAITRIKWILRSKTLKITTEIQHIGIKILLTTKYNVNSRPLTPNMSSLISNSIRCLLNK